MIVVEVFFAVEEFYTNISLFFVTITIFIRPIFPKFVKRTCPSRDHFPDFFVKVLGYT